MTVATTEKRGDAVVVRVTRNIDDMESGEAFKTTLMELYRLGEKEIIIDFGDIRLINSHGIGKILMFYRRFKAIGGAMYVTPLSGAIKEVFESLMLDKLIPERRV